MSLKACDETCALCHGEGWIDMGAGLALCPNDPRKFNGTGVEPSDAEIIKELPETGALKRIQAEGETLFKNGFGLLYLCGPFGIGKSVCVKFWTVQAVEKYKDALYIRQSKMINYLRESFSGDDKQAEYSRRLEKLCSVRWLVIDEVGRDRTTDFAVEVMNEIVDARYQGALRKKTTTVLVSNFEPEKVFDAYIVDRIRDVKNKVLIIQGKSLRGAK